MDIINKFIWAIAVSLLIMTSFYYSFNLKFPQLRLKKIFSCLKEEKDKNNITAKDSLIMSLSSKIGVGSLSGIAFAIYYGGMGTIFWIWVITFFTSINCYVENILSTLYKEKDGYLCKGGPFYYIKNGLGMRKLAIFYSVVALFSYSTGFIAIQNNTMTTMIGEMYDVNIVLVSLIITIISSFIFLRGVKTISNFCNKFFPLMMFIYLIFGLGVIVLNIDILPFFIKNIVISAFDFNSFGGGIIYILLIGVQKGIFQTEAGVGTSAMISGASNNMDYIKQGNTGIVSTYFIGFVISTITAFIIYSSDYLTLSFYNINGIELTRYAFSYHFDFVGEIILLVILVLFAFSTIITAYYYAYNNLISFTNKKLLIFILRIIVIFSLFVGGFLSSSFIWRVVDIFVGILTIVNTYCIFRLKDEVLKKS